MSKYKRLDACPKTFLITYHNEAIDDAQLYVYEYSANNSTEYGYTLYAQGNMPGIRKDVYLGYEDANNIFEGKLSEAISNQGGNFQLDCNDDQCSGHFSFSGTDETTGAPIKFSLNTCTQDRLITFSYKNTPIFSIKQTYDNSGSLTPSILYESENTYKKYPNTEPLHLYYYKNIEVYDSYLTIPDSYITGYRYAWFGLLDSNGKADNNLEYTSTDQLSKYNQKFGCSISGLTIKIMETNLYIKNTALMIVINITQTTEVNRDFKITYDGKFLCNVKKIEKDT